MTDYANEIRFSECTIEHSHHLTADPPLWDAPWRLLSCTHYEGYEVTLVELATDFHSADSDAGIHMNVLLSTFEEASPSYMVTIVDPFGASNVVMEPNKEMATSLYNRRAMTVVNLAK